MNNAGARYFNNFAKGVIEKTDIVGGGSADDSNKYTDEDKPSRKINKTTEGKSSNAHNQGDDDHQFVVLKGEGGGGGGGISTDT
jgi:hypothetical protein